MGRTGCFIVIDAMTERIKHEKTVDVYGHVTLMRSQRNYMVQTEDQYIFIHDALLEAVTCGNTEVPARNLYSYIQRLTQIEPGENVTGMELEFKVSAARMSKRHRFIHFTGHDKGNFFPPCQSSYECWTQGCRIGSYEVGNSFDILLTGGLTSWLKVVGTSFPLPSSWQYGLKFYILINF